MTITLSDQTKVLMESRMKEFGMTDPDEIMFTALQLLHGHPEVATDELDVETRAEIEEAEKQPDIPWEVVRDQLKKEYGLK
jgi:hypothetical protein